MFVYLAAGIEKKQNDCWVFKNDVGFLVKILIQIRI